MVGLPEFQSGDIFFAHADTLVGFGIRVIERRNNKDNAPVNHVGLFSAPTTVIESLFKPGTVEHEFGYVGSGYAVSVYRPNLKDHQVDAVISWAKSYVGKKYGIWKIILHLLGLQKLAFDNNTPICSWVVAKSFAAIGINFGCSPESADPDDIYDYCKAHSDKFTCIVPLTYL